MNWIESSGGPLMLIDKKRLKEWGGDSSSDSNYASDYDRACDTDGYAEVISISGGQAIVFGDEPNRTSVESKSVNEAIIVRWRWAPNEAEILNHLGKLTPSHFENAETLRVRLENDEVVIFDCSFNGMEVGDLLSIRLQSGDFELATIIFEPDNETCMLLHRLKSLG